MKKWIIAAVMMILSPFAFADGYDNAPAFTNGQYYVWSSATVASNALYAVNNSGWFPVVGVNAKTHQPATDKQKTVKWTEAIQQRLDGKWVFPRIPNTKLDFLGVSDAERRAWWNTFLPSIEVMQNGWFPDPEL